MVRVPDVSAILATRPLLFAVTLRVTLPATVALPALMFQACTFAPPEAWLRVTSPLTVKAAVPAWVREFATLLLANVSEVQELSLFIVTTPVVIEIAANAVEFAPPMLCPELPVKVTVPLLTLNVPPLLDQLPETLNAPDALGAVSVPLFNVTLPTVTVPPEPVNVPP